jgi:chorismate synthase
MASNSFGNHFRITTWGESHGKSIGVVIDGCPSLIELSNDDINAALTLRAPGKTPHTSPRKEPDIAEIVSGLFEGKTTGAPISIIIQNKDSDSSKYEPIKDLLRPGHANFTYLEKYGVFDYKGGGRASARETACRVAAGAVASKILEKHGIQVCAYLQSIGTIETPIQNEFSGIFKEKISKSEIFCPDAKAEEKMKTLINDLKKEGDSIGGIVGFVTSPLPIGLGDPIYEKLEANLAKAMLSINASKGFEVGEGFHSAKMKGSENNDEFIKTEKGIALASNHSGGVLAGISTGQPLWGRVVFKPASSIMKSQQTVNLRGEPCEFKLPEGSRHDPCVAIRGVPVVKAMCELVLADALLALSK